jgi:hypothetical protein
VASAALRRALIIAVLAEVVLRLRNFALRARDAGIVGLNPAARVEDVIGGHEMTLQQWLDLYMGRYVHF